MDAGAQDLARKAAEAEGFDEALQLAADALLEQLLAAMRAAGVPKADAAIEALQRSGLDRFLTRALVKGKVSYSMVNVELDRLRGALVSRTLAANEIKLGILAFDDAAQRLALASGKTGPFQYPAQQNHARDSLITFARSLHR